MEILSERHPSYIKRVLNAQKKITFKLKAQWTKGISNISNPKCYFAETYFEKTQCQVRVRIVYQAFLMAIIL